METAVIIGDETVINLQRAKVYVFSDSVLCLRRVHQHPESNKAWKAKIGWIVTDKSYRDYNGIKRELTEFEWNIFPGFTTLQLCMKQNVWHMPKSSPYLQRSLVLNSGHLLVQVLKRSGILWKRIVPKEFGDHIADKMLLEFAESGHPIFRATTPLSRDNLKSKGHGKLSIHFTTDYPTIETIFRIIVLPISSVSTEQLQRCVKNANPFTIDQGNLMY